MKLGSVGSVGGVGSMEERGGRVLTRVGFLQSRGIKNMKIPEMI